MTKEILLTRNKVAIVDDEDFERLNIHNWCALKVKGKWYATRHDPLPDGTDRMVLMHRVILGVSSDSLTDHRDSDGLNNVRSNLRVATYQQNNRNRGCSKNNKSGFKGVYWRKDKKRWWATMTVDRKNIHLGYFDSPEEAARAYDEAALKYHGEFARLNFPE